MRKKMNRIVTVQECDAREA